MNVDTTENKNGAPPAGGVPARIIRQERGFLTALTDSAEYLCSVPRRFLLCGPEEDVYPVIGDQALITIQNDKQAVLSELIPRKNTLKRKKAGNTTEAQILAANIDVAFIVSALDGGRNFNLSRIERFMSVAGSDDIACILVLNKTDLCNDCQKYVDEIHAAFPDVNVLPASALTGDGINTLQEQLRPDSTAILLGPSGVGKSALLNALIGREVQLEGRLRKSDKSGRHTTTNRQMFQLPNNAWVIDTPGIREIQVWDEPETTDAFSDIEEVALNCKFRNCTHQNEPGCAVQQAVADGTIPQKRYSNFIQIRSQQKDTAEKRLTHARISEKRNWKKRKYKNL